MELTKLEKPAEVGYIGIEGHGLIAEEEVEIKVNGNDVLNVQVPEGKKWELEITVRVREFDV